MNLTDKAIVVVVANDVQGLIIIDDFSQLNEKSLEGLCQVLRRPGETSGGVSKPGVKLSAMVENNLHGMIYYIKKFKIIGRKCTQADVELFKVCNIYHQQDMEESHKDPEVVPTVNPRDWPKNLETVEECIRVFRGVYGQPLSYGLREDLIALVVVHDPKYRANGSK